MVLQPNRTLLEDIKATIGKLHAEDESEQGFIDEYFKTVHQGFEYIEMDDELGQFKDNWEKEGPVPKEWKGLHFKVSTVVHMFWWGLFPYRIDLVCSSINNFLCLFK